MYDPTVAGRLEPRLSYVATENRATRPCSQVTIPSVIRKLERCPRHDEALSTSDIEDVLTASSEIRHRQTTALTTTVKHRRAPIYALIS